MYLNVTDHFDKLNVFSSPIFPLKLQIIVYDDVGIQDNIITKTVSSMSDSGEVRPARKCCAQLARILQYLECPQYLRKEFFPKHHDLDYAGLLNPLDAPHHMRQQDDGRFR